MPRELVIRSKNLLERYNKRSLSQEEIGPYSIDTESRIVSQGDRQIKLTSKEYNLLLYFLENISLALSREQILEEIWEENYFGSDRVVDDLVRRLRKKMDKLDIETLYGYGYRMVKDEE